MGHLAIYIEVNFILNEVTFITDWINHQLKFIESKTRWWLK